MTFSPPLHNNILSYCLLFRSVFHQTDSNIEIPNLTYYDNDEGYAPSEMTIIISLLNLHLSLAQSRLTYILYSQRCRFIYIC